MLPSSQTRGTLADNVLHFARVLRAAGLPVGTDRVMLALQALPVAGLEGRADFHAVLSACFVSRHEQQALFDQAFTLYWRDPDLADRMHALLLQRVNTATSPPVRENRRLGDALFPSRRDAPAKALPPAESEPDATLTASAQERLQKADFETMSTEEFREALRLLDRLKPAFPPLATRRRRASLHRGRLDVRATLHAAGRVGGDFLPLRHSQRREVVPPLVVLADISGSMARYSRVLLHFAHLLGQAGPRVETFVFGTRLSRLTPLLRHRDVDVAVAQCTASVPDWSGGTRIAHSLQAFNRQWARRVLGSRATVLLVSDGLEHEATDDLAFEMERLHKSCRRLVWLNPLLRFEGFQPRARGIRAMLPHVDEFRPVHSLLSLAQLVEALAVPPARGMVGVTRIKTSR